MYLVPVLIATAIALVYPSLVLALGVGAIAWAYLSLGGRKIAKDEVQAIRGQIAYRVLSVKLMALNGEVDDGAFEVHGLVTADYVENSELRARLRDAASGTPDHWQNSGRTVRAVYGYDPSELVQRLDQLLTQITAQPACHKLDDGSVFLDDAVQSRLIEIARLWRIGPSKTRDLLAKNQIRPSSEMVAWR